MSLTITYSLGAVALTVAMVREMRAGKVHFLCYHSISNDMHGESTVVSVEEFREQLTTIRKSGWKVVSMSSALAALNGSKALEGKSICITFDDGYANNALVAWPILKEFGYTAHFFICPELVEDCDSIGQDQTSNSQYLTREQVTQLVKEGASVGSHGFSHRNLTSMSRQDIKSQLLRARELLEKWSGACVRTLAYPYGAYDREVERIAAEVGYKAAFTVRMGSVRRSNFYQLRFHLPRINVDSGLKGGALLYKLRDIYDWRGRASELKHYFSRY